MYDWKIKLIAPIECYERIFHCLRIDVLSHIKKHYFLHFCCLFLKSSKTSGNKSAWSNIFWYVKACIFWKCIQNTIHWDKIRMLKKFPLDKINRTKNALFFLSRAQTHHSFTFNLKFLYELKHKIGLSKTFCEIFHFRFSFVFIKVYIFVHQKAWTLWV